MFLSQAAMEQMGPPGGQGGMEMPMQLTEEELDSVRSEAERILAEHTRPGLTVPSHPCCKFWWKITCAHSNNLCLTMSGKGCEFH